MFSFKKVVREVAWTIPGSHILRDDMLSEGILRQNTRNQRLGANFWSADWSLHVLQWILYSTESCCSQTFLRHSCFFFWIVRLWYQIITISNSYWLKKEEKYHHCSVGFFFYIPAEPDNPVPSNLVSLPVLLDICVSDGDSSVCLLNVLE